mmetsp:Transcript_8774/g.24082  ORF Transcript_8774/g.24082 Transcript_8774/m.24082 type:complete len:220 (-) Transcript_8774:129-788(-)
MCNFVNSTLVVVATMALLHACRAAKYNVSDDTIVIESFEDPMHTWQEMNDPVMGGKSTGTFSIEGGVGKFEGEVVEVPFLHAPGFIQARTTNSKKYPDVSSCKALEIVAKTNTDYAGYRISFGNAHAPGGKYFAYGYKSHLEIERTDEFQTVTIPFDEFTDFWDDATGDPIHTCHENKLYCPDELTLKNMERIAVWGEGVAGKVSLEIRSLSAVGCSSE